MTSVADPAAATIISSNYGSMLADVGASGEARPAELHAQASGHTENINAKAGFYSAPPYGYGYAHSFDRLTVKSDSLAEGDAVTIVFGNQVDLNTWTYKGLYDGYIDMSLQIGAGTAHSRWTASYLYGVTASEAPQITVRPPSARSSASTASCGLRPRPSTGTTPSASAATSRPT